MSGKTAYAWKPGARANVSAQVAGEEIDRIRAQEGNFFAPEAVVIESYPESAPLHSQFEWNDAKAGAAHRVNQAKYLIRSIVTVSVGGPIQETVRAFVSVRLDDGEPQYTSTAHAMSDAQLREQMLCRAVADIRAFEAKYRAYLNLADVMDAFEIARMKAMRLHENAAD